LKVDGPVYSNSPSASLPGSIAANPVTLDAVGHTITARGLCNGTFSPSCTSDATAAVEGTTYDTSSDWSSQSVPTNVVSASDFAGHCGSDNPLVPGEYKDATQLGNLATACGAAGKILWFQPGVYYFEFPTSDPVLNLSGPGVHVVGGQLTSTPALPGSACKGEKGTPDQTDGVQWIFGGPSQVSVSGQASLDLCPKPTDPSSTKQEIAVFGLRHDGPTTSGSQSVVPASYSDPTSTNLKAFSNQSNALTLSDSGSSATYAYPSSNPKRDGAITLKSFDFSSIPASATINSATIEVRFQSTSRSFKELDLTLADGDGSKTIQSTTAACNNTNTTNLCLGANGSGFFDQSFSLPTPLTASGLSSLTAEFDALLLTGNGDQSTSDKTSLDGMKVTVNYTTSPAYKAQSGCVTAHTCDFIYASGATTSMVIAGTVYAWDATVRINLPTETAVALQRGAVASTFNITAPPAGIANQIVVGLPPNQVTTTTTVTHTVAGDRDVVLVASIGGRPIVRTEVLFKDTGDGSAEVKHWSDVG